MNIAFSKIGRAILFGHSTESSGGNLEPISMLRLLANNNPNISFFIISPSNYSQLSKAQQEDTFPHKNVHDCYAGIVSARVAFDDENFLTNWFSTRSIKVDAHVCMPGAIPTVNLPNKIQQVGDPTKMASVMVMGLRYCASVIRWMNQNKSIRMIELITDPRCRWNMNRDCMKVADVSLGQYDFTYNRRHIKSYKNQSCIVTPVSTRYSAIETNFLYGKGGPNTDFKNRKTLFAVVLNEGLPSRYNMLNEWVLSQFKQLSVYGKWQHPDAQPSVDARFKGTRTQTQVQRAMTNVKASFAIPITKGWVTSKVVELAHAGVIPILHPSYDDQNHLGLPKEVRPASPDELRKLLVRLKDNDFYEQLIKKVQRIVCKPSYYDGTHLCKQILTAIDPTYKLPAAQKVIQLKRGLF
jgi:hypothetical protein